MTCACIVVPVFVFFLLYAGGFFAQFMINYNTWTKFDVSYGEGTAPALPSGSVAACFKALTVAPYNLYGVLICLLLVGVLVIFVLRLGFGGKGTYDKERNLVYSEKGTYGTYGFMTEEEMNKVLEVTGNIEQSRGIILGLLEGKAVCLPEKTRLNRNVAVFGASGSMKSRAYARNVIFQCVKRGESLIISVCSITPICFD